MHSKAYKIVRVCVNACVCVFASVYINMYYYYVCIHA